MRIIICLSVFFVSLLANSQSILPAAKSFKPTGKRQTTTPVSQEERLENFRNFYTDTATSLFVRQEGNTNRKSFSEILDSIAGEQVDDDEKIALENRIIELNKSNAVRPLATGGISNLENSSQSYGSLSVGLQFRLTKYKLIGKKNWIDPQFITVLYSAKTATSPDSSSIQKTFMFPELNKRDFAIGYRWEFLKNDWTVAPSFEFSFNKFMDSTLKKKFVSQSIIAGLRVQKEFPSTTLNSYLSLFPYYSLILVEKKYAVDYRELTGEKKIPGRFHSFGMNVSVQSENGILFCNMKYILGMADKVESQDLKTFIYTIGTLMAL